MRNNQATGPGILQRLRWSVQLFGIPALAKSAAIRVCRKHRDFARIIGPGTIREIAFDQKFDVVTRRLNVDDQSHGVGYQPADAHEFAITIDCLPIDHKEWSFVDIGSGAGRLLLIAGAFRFQRVIGIELSQHLHSAAVSNLQNSKLKRRCNSVKSYCADALDFELPPGDKIIYLYNPFSRSVLAAFCDRLVEQHKQGERLLIVYRNPVDRDIFDGADSFQSFTTTASAWAPQTIYYQTGLLNIV